MLQISSIICMLDKVDLHLFIYFTLDKADLKLEAKKMKG